MSGDKYSRQSFLGDGAQGVIERAVVGIAGLGGGGSHIVQQLAHVGFQNYAVVDPDVAEDANWNRLIGATASDFAGGILKIEIAERVIKGICPHASVQAFAQRWQDNPDALRACDIIFGCVDGFGERRELEAFTRRHMIPLIDIGMDVHRVGGEAPRMGGQVILSMPGDSCMFCLGFLNEVALTREAERYGDAGPRPQVVWPNGVLASTAVGTAIDLLTDWTRSLRDVVYMSYDGNRGTIQPHVRLQYLGQKVCSHYPLSEVGDPALLLETASDSLLCGYA